MRELSSMTDIKSTDNNFVPERNRYNDSERPAENNFQPNDHGMSDVGGRYYDSERSKIGNIQPYGFDVTMPKSSEYNSIKAVDTNDGLKTGDNYKNEKARDNFQAENIGDIGKNCPIENGTWDGDRGDSKWRPNGDFIPQKRNPENQTWDKILDKYDIDGIDFKDGEPDFDDISKGDVEIEGFSDSRDDNFDKADIKLAEQKGCSPEDVEKWRKSHGYTWHECKDMKTMQKVPSIVHNNVSHRGGISEKKIGG